MLTISAMTLGIWLQEPGALSSGGTQWLTVFVGIVAICFLAIAITFGIVAVGVTKGMKRLLVVADEIHRKSLPVIASAEVLIRENSPKIKVITENLAETSHIVRAKAQELDSTLTDVNTKARAQVSRVDTLVSTTLARTAALADTIHDGIRVPVKQAAGVVNGFRAGLDVLMSKTKSFGSYRKPDQY